MIVHTNAIVVTIRISIVNLIGGGGNTDACPGRAANTLALPLGLCPETMVLLRPMYVFGSSHGFLCLKGSVTYQAFSPQLTHEIAAIGGGGGIK